MVARISSLIALVVIVFCSTGCVSEWVNKAIGDMVKDPEPLVTPKDPDEPLFDPKSEQLIEHSRNEDITDRFSNTQ